MTQLYWLHTLSPTHVGTGRGLGYIDLPIQRDKLTNWPIIPGSAFKGVWADHHRATEESRVEGSTLALAFGRASNKDPNASNAGALIPTDARILCLPVRSFNGTFAWCTSPLALQMLQRDLAMAGMPSLNGLSSDLLKSDDGLTKSSIYLTDTSILDAQDQESSDDSKKVYLEDLDFTATRRSDLSEVAEQLASWLFPDTEQEAHAWRAIFCERFALVHNSVFDFLCETGTEVSTRIRLDDELKIVMDRQLWNEEALPAETILVGLIACDRIYGTSKEQHSPQELLQEFTKENLMLQLGGKASVGRGRVRCVFTAYPELRQ